MDIGAKEIILVLVGFFLSWAPQWFDRRRRIAAHWAALRAETTLCIEKAIALRNAGIMAPLYRLPTLAFEKSFPVLLAEGEIAETESLALNRFFGQVQDINRGLDNATSMAHTDQAGKLEQEYRRNLIKVQELIIGSDGSGGLSQAATNLINAKLAHRWWRR